MKKLLLGVPRFQTLNEMKIGKEQKIQIIAFEFWRLKQNFRTKITTDAMGKL